MRYLGLGKREISPGISAELHSFIHSIVKHITMKQNTVRHHRKKELVRMLSLSIMDHLKCPTEHWKSCACLTFLFKQIFKTVGETRLAPTVETPTTDRVRFRRASALLLSPVASGHQSLGVLCSSF